MSHTWPAAQVSKPNPAVSIGTPVLTRVASRSAWFGRSCVALVTCAFCCQVIAAAARAHEPPKGFALVWTHEALDSLPVVFTNRGLVFPAPDAADGSFSLRCNEAYGVNTAARPSLIADAAGQLVLATYSAISRTHDRGCSWQPSAGLPNATLGRPIQHDQARKSLLLTTVDVEPGSSVLASEDYGVTWSALAALEPGEVYTALAWAPSDVQRVYASGLKVDQEQGNMVWLWARSSDRGQTFERDSVEQERRPLAVHPTDPDIVFAYELSDPLAGRYRVLRSQDAGATFEQVIEISDVTSFAARPDGVELWLGAGRDGGLYRSIDHGKSFARVHEEIREVQCLHHRAGKLWVCANMLPNVDGVWTTDDGGETFETVLTFDQVTEPVMCDEPTDAEMCSLPWLDWEREVLAPLAPAPDEGSRDAGGEPDAGSGSEGGIPGDEEASAPPPPRSAGAESCAIGYAAGSRFFGLLMLVLFALIRSPHWRGKGCRGLFARARCVREAGGAAHRVIKQFPKRR